MIFCLGIKVVLVIC